MKTRRLSVLILILYVLSILAGCHSSKYTLEQQPGTQLPQKTTASGQTTDPLDTSDPAETEPPTDPTDPIITTKPTEPTDPIITTEPTEPSEPNTPTDPAPTEPDPNVLTEEEIAYLQEFYAYRDPNSEEGPNYYNTALATGFIDPRHISFAYFFCNGDQTNWQETGMTDEEYAFIMENVRDADLPGMKFYRIKRADLRRIYYMCFGITVEDSEKAELMYTAYWDVTDCYYSATQIPAWSLPEFTIVSGKHLPDGTMEVYYTTPLGFYHNYIMILKPVDGGFHMLSNQEIISTSTA